MSWAPDYVIDRVLDAVWDNMSDDEWAAYMLSYQPLPGYETAEAS